MLPLVICGSQILADLLKGLLLWERVAIGKNTYKISRELVSFIRIGAEEYLQKDDRRVCVIGGTAFFAQGPYHLNAHGFTFWFLFL